MFGKYLDPRCTSLVSGRWTYLQLNVHQNYLQLELIFAKLSRLKSKKKFQITRRLETIFLQNNRREIKPPQEPEPEKAEAADADTKTDVKVEVVVKNDDGEKDDRGNWKRRKLDKDDDEEEEEFENEGRYF